MDSRGSCDAYERVIFLTSYQAGCLAGFLQHAAPDLHDACKVMDTSDVGQRGPDFKEAFGIIPLMDGHYTS